MTASFTISAFGDEIADDLDTQLETMLRLNVHFLELRGVWGKNVSISVMTRLRHQ